MADYAIADPRCALGYDTATLVVRADEWGERQV
jgi:hypothetical protein